MAPRSHVKAWKEINQYELGQCRGGLGRWRQLGLSLVLGHMCPWQSELKTKQEIDILCLPFWDFLSSWVLFYKAFLQYISITQQSFLVSSTSSHFRLCHVIAIQQSIISFSSSVRLIACSAIIIVFFFFFILKSMRVWGFECIKVSGMCIYWDRMKSLS